MINKNNSFEKNLILISSFILAIVFLLFSYKLLNIFPFGDNSILTVDLRNQYIDFLAYFKQTIENKEMFFYSFSKGIGGNMIALFAYYIASPFNFILLLFSLENIPKAIIYITLIKTGCIGMSMTYFLLKRFNSYKFYIPVFSVAYALSSYSIAYQQNLMWMDALILLPLIALGIFNLIHKKGFMLYFFSLFIAIVSNWYIGYMLCIFSVLYFLYEYFQNKDYGINTILTFIFVSLTSV